MNGVDIAKKLKEARIRAGFTQKQVYEKIGVPQSTFSSWEVGKSEPNAETFLSLCSLYGIKSLKELGFDAVYENFSHAEQSLIKKYNALDGHGMKAVDAILAIEYERIQHSKSQKKAAKKVQPPPFNEEYDTEYVEMKIYSVAAAAGFGNYLSENEDAYDVKSFPANEIPRQADFGIRITGDSMEPTITNGSTVWVGATPELRSGEVGIFVLNGESYCKELCIEYSNEGAKEVSLISHNDEYEPLAIKRHDELRTVGRVIPG